MKLLDRIQASFNHRRFKRTRVINGLSLWRALRDEVPPEYPMRKVGLIERIKLSVKRRDLLKFYEK